MRYVLNALYLFLFVLLTPWLLFKFVTAGKYRRGNWAKFAGLSQDDLPPPTGPRVWFHGVSVGEIHLLRQVVAAFRKRHPDWQCVVSSTTDSGFDEARKAFPDLPVIFYPFDFSWAVARTLRAVQPALIVLAESELWPNFLTTAKRQHVPVAVINGRMSPRSLKRHRFVGLIIRFVLVRQLDLLAVQTRDYAVALTDLGAEPKLLHVTGNIKYDGVTTNRDNPQTEDLRALFNVQPGDLIWISGSTQAPEEQASLQIYQCLRAKLPQLRLFIVPRQKARFDEVARLLERSGQPFVRRSELMGQLADRDRVVLVDTIGELSALWGLADLAFVGGSLDGKRGGQNMIEPAAFGAAVVFGPHVWNFSDTVWRLLAEKAAVQVANAEELEATLLRLAQDTEERNRMGQAAQRFVMGQQGATARTIELLTKMLPASEQRAAA